MKVRTYFWTDNQQNNANVELEAMFDEWTKLHSATNISDMADSFSFALRRMAKRENSLIYQHMIDSSKMLNECFEKQREYDALYRGIPNREKENIMSLIKGIYIDKAEDRIAKIKNSKKYKESDNEDFRAKLLEKAGTYNRVTVAFKDGRVGTADCDPQDTFDPFIGFCIATCKALAGSAGSLYRLYNSKLNK